MRVLKLVSRILSPFRDKHRDETQRDTINRLSVYEEQL